jgi:hypothetical protein
MSQHTRPCAVCRQAIDPERAEGLPDTIICVRCAPLVRKHGGEFLRSIEQERLSKPGSLKRSFGGVGSRIVGRNWTALERAREDLAGRSDG